MCEQREFQASTSMWPCVTPITFERTASDYQSDYALFHMPSESGGTAFKELRLLIGNGIDIVLEGAAMQLSEALALRWDAVDMTKRVAHVCRTVALGVMEERTKPVATDSSCLMKESCMPWNSPRLMQSAADLGWER